MTTIKKTILDFFVYNKDRITSIPADDRTRFNTRPTLNAWEDTFHVCPKNLDIIDSTKRSFANYFLGWPKGIGARISYILFLGWLLLPLKNILKTLTEFPLCAAKESLMSYIHKLDTQNTPRAKYLMAALIPLQLTTKILWGVVRIFTSPRTTVKAIYGMIKKSVTKLREKLFPNSTNQKKESCSGQTPATHMPRKTSNAQMTKQLRGTEVRSNLPHPISYIKHRLFKHKTHMNTEEIIPTPHDDTPVYQGF